MRITRMLQRYAEIVTFTLLSVIFTGLITWHLKSSGIDPELFVVRMVGFVICGWLVYLLVLVRRWIRKGK